MKSSIGDDDLMVLIESAVALADAAGDTLMAALLTRCLDEITSRREQAAANAPCATSYPGRPEVTASAPRNSKHADGDHH